MSDRSGNRVGRFVVEEHIGAGGMGEVYRARDPQLERQVAIKRLPAELANDAELRATLLREARNAARITDQRVAALYDVLERGDDLYLVMEYVEGTTLRERLGVAVPEDELLHIAEQCAEGLAAAHRQGVVHGDIKPENIMIGPRGDVKLLDFGVSRLTVGSDDATYQTTDAAAEVGGTVSYMAPEVLMGHRSDHRADLFSLGVVLYEMATRRHPFRGSTAIATTDRILHDAHRPLTAVNPICRSGLQAVIDKMLAKDPEERYATADDLAVDLRHLRAEVTKPKARRAEARSAPTDRRWLAPAVAAGMLVVLAIVWGALQWSGGEPAGTTSASPVSFDASDWVIAVLPVAATGDDQELRALRAGLAATLTTRLTQLTRSHGLQVIPASSVRELGIDGLERARRELGVTLALNLEARRMGEGVRVNVNLVDARARRQLDGDTVDGSLEDLIAVEERVALRALRMLRIELLPMEQSLLDAGTDEPRAHAYYVRTRGYLHDSADDESSVDAAIELLEQALRIDPEYALAHADLGRALWRKYEFTREPRWANRAAQACDDAVARDQLSAEGHACLGVVYAGTGRFDEAISELEIALRVKPTDDAIYVELADAYLGSGDVERAEATYEQAIAVRPHYATSHIWLGAFYIGQGRVDDAIAAYQQAASLAPDSYSSFSGLGVAYYYADRLADAQRAFERALELEPNYATATSNLGTMYFYDGRYADAARQFERATELAERNYLYWGNLGDAYHWAPGERERAAGAYRRAIELAEEELAVNASDAIALQDVARYYAMSGDAAAARATIARALELAPTDIYVLRSSAVVHVALGEREAAIEALLAAIAAGDSRAEISVDPMFAELREDPRLREALASG